MFVRISDRIQLGLGGQAPSGALTHKSLVSRTFQRTDDRGHHRSVQPHFRLRYKNFFRSLSKYPSIDAEAQLKTDIVEEVMWQPGTSTVPCMCASFS